MVHQILVASYTDDITTLSFDPSSRSLKITSATQVGHRPSWIAPHPSDRSLAFACLEHSEGFIVFLRVDDAGNVNVVNKVPSHGDDPCHVVVENDEILVSNYSSGHFAILPLSAESNPLKFANEEPFVFRLIGSGPNQERQQSAHPHQAYLNRDLSSKKEILVPDLGSDKTLRIVKDEACRWRVQGQIEYEAGSGPRHVLIYNGYLYTLFELKNELATHRLPSFPAEPTHLSTVPILLNPPTPNTLCAAEILLALPSAAFPRPFLYVSNRDDPSPEGDTIAIFSLDDPERPELVAEVRTGMKHVRGIALGGEDGRWLIAGGVKEGGVKMYERTEGGRNLKEIASVPNIEAPTGFLWR